MQSGWRLHAAAPTEVRLVQPAGTAQPKTLYSDADLVRLRYVTP